MGGGVYRPGRPERRDRTGPAAQPDRTDRPDLAEQPVLADASERAARILGTCSCTWGGRRSAGSRSERKNDDGSRPGLGLARISKESFDILILGRISKESFDILLISF